MVSVPSTTYRIREALPRPRGLSPSSQTLALNSEVLSPNYYEYTRIELESRKEDAVRTIRELRQERGWTQLELANRLAVTPSSVHNWESGKFEPKAAQLRALARAFGVSMDEIDFGGGEGEGEKPPPRAT